MPDLSKVAFGLIVQLVMENHNPTGINEVLDFCIQVGLPVCFDDLGLGEVSRDDNETFSITEELVLDALLTADTLGSFQKKFKGIS